MLRTTDCRCGQRRIESHPLCPSQPTLTPRSPRQDFASSLAPRIESREDSDMPRKRTGNVRLEGELPVAELDLDSRDELVRANSPVEHDLEVQRIEDELLVRGRVHLVLDCECARCLKPFKHEIDLDDFTLLLPLTGEESVSIENDCVDLTPWLREDTLLAFPQHPLCDPQCGGLEKGHVAKSKPNSAGRRESSATAWADLDKLKLKD